MAKTKVKDRKIAEFGDFQTPDELAVAACNVLDRLNLAPLSIVEPTCGVGSFLDAALSKFTGARRALGVDVNADYIATARSRLQPRFPESTLTLSCESFFTTPWQNLFAELPEPILVIGNPPWVTNAHLGALGSSNLPEKTNFQKHNGFDAVTGKSNFDISEWMLIHLLEWLQHRDATLAMLCKTAVARKTLFHAWKNKIRVQSASMYLIDAAKHFDAAVDACFLVCRTVQNRTSYDCRVFKEFTDPKPVQTFGYRDGQVVADVEAFDRWKHLQGAEHYKWRSGIKHDCSSIMELRREGSLYRNGLGELVELELRYLFPMLKSSAVANGNVCSAERWMIVPQQLIGEETESIAANAPLTWQYLQRHAHLLAKRGSSIYKKRPPFSIFGVGDYSFSPWKVAVSGFYKSLKFRVVGGIDGKPFVLDDTTNFLSCSSLAEAELLSELLNSPTAAGFFKGFIFWDAKRPLTIDLLRRLDLTQLARELRRHDELAGFMAHREAPKQRKPKAKAAATLFTEALID